MDFKWILNFDAYEKIKLDLLTFKITKYLLYRFNDFLESQGQPLIKIKHSKLTDDYIAAEKIQNQNQHYFIVRVLEVVMQKRLGAQLENLKTF